MTKKSVSDWNVTTDSDGIKLNLYSGKEYLQIEIEDQKIHYVYIEDNFAPDLTRAQNCKRKNVSFQELVNMLLLIK